MDLSRGEDETGAKMPAHSEAKGGCTNAYSAAVSTPFTDARRRERIESLCTPFTRLLQARASLSRRSGVLSVVRVWDQCHAFMSILRLTS
jgi:hypothetical protein